MSTIYTFHAECSSVDTLASGDRILIWDASTGRTEYALFSDFGFATTGSSSQVSFTASGVCVLIGTTASSKVGMYGKAGTSQRAGSAQASVTYTAVVNSGSVSNLIWAFSTSAAIDGLAMLLLDIRTALVDIGIIKGSS